MAGLCLTCEDVAYQKGMIFTEPYVSGPDHDVSRDYIKCFMLTCDECLVI